MSTRHSTANILSNDETVKTDLKMLREVILADNEKSVVRLSNEWSHVSSGARRTIYLHYVQKPLETNCRIMSKLKSERFQKVMKEDLEGSRGPQVSIFFLLFLRL